jgi:hypothetical protein
MEVAPGAETEPVDPEFPLFEKCKKYKTPTATSSTMFKPIGKFFM